MKDVIEKATTAKRQVVEGSLEIWNARLQILQNIGDIRRVLDLLKDPVEPVADNGNCGGCNCGVEPLGAEIQTAPMKGKS